MEFLVQGMRQPQALEPSSSPVTECTRVIPTVGLEVRQNAYGWGGEEGGTTCPGCVRRGPCVLASSIKLNWPQATRRSLRFSSPLEGVFY